MRRIAIANRKGGTGKSTTAVHLAAGLAEMDCRVRLPEAWWRALTDQAAAEGLKPSQLLRQIVAEYLHQ